MDTSNGMAIFMQLLFEKEIHFFKDYLETLEEFLRTEVSTLTQNLETLDLGYEPLPEQRDGARDEDDYEAEHEEYYEPSPRQVEDQLRDRLDEIDGFANLLRSSFFVSLYSFLESRLKKECQSRKSAHIAATLSDISGHKNELDRFKKYFAEVLQIYFPGDTTQWQEIQNYRVLRNCIVHTRGTLSDFKKKTKRDCLYTLNKSQTYAFRETKSFSMPRFAAKPMKPLRSSSVF
jgi:hypothetical protein